MEYIVSIDARDDEVDWTVCIVPRGWRLVKEGERVPDGAKGWKLGVGPWVPADCRIWTSLHYWPMIVPKPRITLQFDTQPHMEAGNEQIQSDTQDTGSSPSDQLGWYSCGPVG